LVAKHRKDAPLHLVDHVGASLHTLGIEIAAVDSPTRIERQNNGIGIYKEDTKI